MFRVRVRRRILWRVTVLRRCLRSIWNQIFSCAASGKSAKYRQLPSSTTANTMSSSPSVVLPGGGGFDSGDLGPPCRRRGENIGGDSCSDLVALKITLLGDCQIGKTSFLAKYAGEETEEGGYQAAGSNRMEKTMCVRGARIGYSIWEVGGDGTSQNNMPDTCKDSVAVLIMFDLTSRCTLSSVIGWYNEARKWNKTAIPVLVGTKFDEFVQLPMDLQWTIASQARGYAKALNATLFFSSATYNINVNKIFKFITARLFNLPWTVERNLTIGEPIIDF